MQKYRIIMTRRFGRDAGYLVSVNSGSKAEEALREVQLTPREYEIFFNLLIKRRCLEDKAESN